MPSYRLSGLADDVLLRQGAASARNESACTALLLAHIAEIERRRLYADEGHDSMCAFCVAEWGLCEYAAYRRIGAARAALAFPALFEAVAEGRLNLTTVNLLAPALTAENAAGLIAAASGLTKRQLQDLLDERAVARAAAAARGAAGDPLAAAPAGLEDENVPLAPALVAPNGASEVRPAKEPAARPAAARFPLHALLGRAEQDDFEYLQALLGHAVPSGNLVQVLGRVFRAAIRQLEREKFAVGARTRGGARGPNAPSRCVPDAVRRAVFIRDRGRCTFEGAKGHRCGSQRRLEFDHIIPVAKGGQSTADNVRLHCRTHNQLAAERAFGAGFMERKRAESRRRAGQKREAARAKEAEFARKKAHARELAANAEAQARAMEVVPWLRRLGFSEREARGAAATCEALPVASLEERVRHALRGLAPASARRVTPFASGPA